jgi:hypothetical protein
MLVGIYGLVPRYLPLDASLDLFLPAVSAQRFGLLVGSVSACWSARSTG